MASLQNSVAKLLSNKICHGQRNVAKSFMANWLAMEIVFHHWLAMEFLSLKKKKKKTK